MTHLGGGTDEYSIEAGSLNQTHIGSDFGVKYGAGVLYGRVGSVKVYPKQVFISLAGVAGGAIQLEPETLLYFSRHQHDAQVLGHLENFSDHLRK